MTKTAMMEKIEKLENRMLDQDKKILLLLEILSYHMSPALEQQIREELGL